MAAGRPVERERLFALYVPRLLDAARQLRAGEWDASARGGPPGPGVAGGRVRVLPGRGGAPFEAVTDGIDATGALRVRDDAAPCARSPWGRACVHLEGVMLLAVDVGNTHTVLGLFEGEERRADWRIPTRTDTTVDELGVLFRALLRDAGLAGSASRG
jgi:hypothetical protein